MLFANVCAGFISSCYGDFGSWRLFVFCFFGLLLSALCIWRVPAWLAYPLVCRAWVSKMCLLLDTPFGRRSGGEGGGGHYLCYPWEFAAQLIKLSGIFMRLVIVSQMGSRICWPSCRVSWVKGALWRICRQKHGKTSFSPSRVFLFSRVDFLAVVEHRMIPARVRSEWARLKAKGLGSIWAPACQDFSHVGNAWMVTISMRGAPVSLPTFAVQKVF